MITHEEIVKYLEYSEETGVFTWKISRTKASKGYVAGRKDDDGRIRIGINGKLYSAHRLAWLYVYGGWPEDQIDHKNGNTADNRISNLRCVTGTINARNRKKRLNNISGYNGVTKRQNGKYQARIRINGTKKTLGTFDTAYEAHISYEKEKILHGYTIDHGIR